MKSNMKIALPYDEENKNLFQHMGMAEAFKVYEIDDKTKEIKSETILKTNGEKHAQIADFLSENKIDVLICGGCGDRMYNLLVSKNILCFTSQQGDCSTIIESYLNNTMEKVSRPTHCCHHGE